MNVETIYQHVLGQRLVDVLGVYGGRLQTTGHGPPGGDDGQQGSNLFGTVAVGNLAVAISRMLHLGDTMAEPVLGQAPVGGVVTTVSLQGVERVR